MASEPGRAGVSAVAPPPQLFLTDGKSQLASHTKILYLTYTALYADKSKFIHFPCSLSKSEKLEIRFDGILVENLT